MPQKGVPLSYAEGVTLYIAIGQNPLNQFPLESSQQVRNINDKSVTSWQLPRLRLLRTIIFC